MRRRLPRSGVLLACLLLAVPAVAQETAPEPETEETSEPQRRPRGYFRRHLLHLVTAFGTNLAGNEYANQVGTSTDPLIFSDPPGFDRRIRDWLRSDDPEKNYYLQNRAAVGLLLTAGTIVAANLRDEHPLHWMADDATGLLELWFFDKGATELAKNIFGRQRPQLEFSVVDPNSESDENLRHSFWSGAASRQFALMAYADQVVAGRVHSRGARAVSFAGFHALAAYVGYSRIANDEHYFTDVVAGAAVGILEARGFYRAHHPRHGRLRHPEGPAVRLESFSAIPGGAAVMFSVRIPS